MARMTFGEQRIALGKDGTITIPAADEKTDPVVVGQVTRDGAKWIARAADNARLLGSLGGTKWPFTYGLLPLSPGCGIALGWHRRVPDNAMLAAGMSPAVTHSPTRARRYAVVNRR